LVAAYRIARENFAAKILVLSRRPTARERNRIERQTIRRHRLLHRQVGTTNDKPVGPQLSAAHRAVFSAVAEDRQELAPLR